MDDCIEVYGEGGVTFADLHMGNALPTYSEYGFGYAVEKAPHTKGWSWPVYEELWNYGFPQEMHHFAAACEAANNRSPRATTAASFRKSLYAGYQSARAGCKVALPFRPTGIERPIDLWLDPS